MPAASIIAAPAVDAATARPTTGRGRPDSDAGVFAGLMDAPVEDTVVARPTPPAKDTPRAQTLAPATDAPETPVETDVADQDADAVVVAVLLIQPAPPPPAATAQLPSGATGTTATAPDASADADASGVTQTPTPPAEASGAMLPAEADATPPIPVAPVAAEAEPAQAAVVAATAAASQQTQTAPASPQQTLQALLSRAASPLPVRSGGAASDGATEDQAAAPATVDTSSAEAGDTAEITPRPAPTLAPPAPVAGASAALHQMRSALLGDAPRSEGASSSVASPDASATATPSAPVDDVATAAAAPTVTVTVPASAAAEVAARNEPAPATAAPASQPATPLDQAPAAAARIAASGLSQVAIETTAQIAAQIALRLEGRQTRFDMVLTPDDLGRVDVSIDIDADGQLAARLAFDNPAAAADLRGRADELRRQLQDAGFQVAGDGLDFSERDGGASRGGSGDREASPAFARAARLSAAADAASIPATPVWRSLSLTPDGVDVRV